MAQPIFQLPGLVNVNEKRWKIHPPSRPLGASHMSFLEELVVRFIAGGRASIRAPARESVLGSIYPLLWEPVGAKILKFTFH